MSHEYYEDYTVGETHETDGRTVTETDVVNFNRTVGLYDRMFVDVEYITEVTPFDGLYVPGEMTAALTLGSASRTDVFGAALALLGFETNFPNPLLVDDTITVSFEVLDKEETSNPEQGIVTFGYTTRNQHDEVVAELEETVLVKRRGDE